MQLSLTQAIFNPIVSYVQNEEYVPITLNLCYTVQKYNPNIPYEKIILLPTDHTVSPMSLARFQELGWTLRLEEPIEVEGSENLPANYRRNFVKLHIWKWIEFRKLAYIDGDCLVLGDISLLLSEGIGTTSFYSNQDFGAVRDTWPWAMPSDNFNAGVMSLTPSLEIYNQLFEITTTRPTPPGAEQDILNVFFPPVSMDNTRPEYTRTDLPMKYNLNMEACRAERLTDRFNEIWPHARILHFTGPAKGNTGECNDPGCNCAAHNTWKDEYKEMCMKYGWSTGESLY